MRIHVWWYRELLSTWTQEISECFLSHPNVLMAFCSLQTIEMHEDSMEYYITGLVISPHFLMYSSTISLVPHITERIKLRWEMKPPWSYFTNSTCQTHTERLQHLCVGENMQNICSVSLAFTFSSCLGSSDCLSSVGTEIRVQLLHAKYCKWIWIL